MFANCKRMAKRVWWKRRKVIERNRQVIFAHQLNDLFLYPANKSKTKLLIHFSEVFETELIFRRLDSFDHIQVRKP